MIFVLLTVLPVYACIFTGLTGQEKTSQLKEPGTPVCAYLSPDGKTFLTLTLGFTVKVWDAYTGNLLSVIK